jgi:hypothetical protein
MGKLVKSYKNNAAQTIVMNLPGEKLSSGVYTLNAYMMGAIPGKTRKTIKQISSELQELCGAALCISSYCSSILTFKILAGWSAPSLQINSSPAGLKVIPSGCKKSTVFNW